MSDYIKREDAIERLSYHADFYQNDREFGGEEMLYKDSALNEISELPSADVVEVVRCKDCKNRYYDKDRDFYYCRMWYGLGSVLDDNFCSLGVKK